MGLQRLRLLAGIGVVATVVIAGCRSDRVNAQGEHVPSADLWKPASQEAKYGGTTRWLFMPPYQGDADVGVTGVWSVGDDVVVRWMPYEPGVRPQYLTAADAETGRNRWSQETHRPSRVAAIDNGELYCALLGYGVSKIRSSDGEVLWTTELAQTGLGHGFAVGPHALYAIDWERARARETRAPPQHPRDGRLNALERETGAVMWRKEFRESVLGVAAGKNRIYVAVAEGPLYGLRAQDGATAWENDAIACCSRPAAFGEHVVVPGLRDVFKVRGDDGGIVWAQPLERGRLIASGPGDAAKVVCVVDAEGSLHALDLSTGLRLWKWSPPMKLESRPRPVYAWTGDGNLVGVVRKPASEPPISEVVLISSQSGAGVKIGALQGAVAHDLVVRDMTVFVIVGDGSLVALDVEGVNAALDGNTRAAASLGADGEGLR